MCLNSARRQRRLKRLAEHWGDLHALALAADSAMDLPEASHHPNGPALEPPPVSHMPGKLCTRQQSKRPDEGRSRCTANDIFKDSTSCSSVSSEVQQWGVGGFRV